MGIRVEGEHAADILRSTPQEVAKAALGIDLLMATAVLRDQAQMGSMKQNFANFIFQSVEQNILANLPKAMGELEKFSKKAKFQGRQLQWIKFLIGGTVTVFRYKNCYAFRKGNTKLERDHDYV
jgi:hypothetical protein